VVLGPWAGRPVLGIASYITAAEKFDFEPIPIFMLARDNALIGDDPANVSFEREEIYTDPTTGKPVAATTRYTYRDGDERYVVTFTRSHDLSADRMIDGVRCIKRIAAKLAHFDGAYSLMSVLTSPLRSRTMRLISRPSGTQRRLVIAFTRGSRTA
jgi:hypothetical protein